MDDHATCNESAAYNESYVRTLWKIQAGYYKVVTFSNHFSKTMAGKFV